MEVNNCIGCKKPPQHYAYGPEFSYVCLTYRTCPKAVKVFCKTKEMARVCWNMLNPKGKL